MTKNYLGKKTAKKNAIFCQGKSLNLSIIDVYRGIFSQQSEHQYFNLYSNILYMLSLFFEAHYAKNSRRAAKNQMSRDFETR